MYCTNCGKEVNKQAVICVACGVTLDHGNRYCQNCGVEVSNHSGICSKCGVMVSGTQKSKLVAGLLGVFLGCLGVHRFYLGYIGIGILQIIATLITCGIGSLWGFIEGIVILAGGWSKDAKGFPLKNEF